MRTVHCDTFARRPRHGSAICSHSEQFVALPQSNAELPPARRLVVPMVARDEVTRFSQRDWHNS